MSALPGTTGRRRLYLMRHGFVDYTSKAVRESEDPSRAVLTVSGREEARAAGVALREVHFDLALCSGLHRTRETAEIVLSEHPYDLTLEDEPRFTELQSGRYIDFESAEQLAATMTFQFEQAGEPGATFLEGGEPFADAAVRIEAGVRSLLARPGWHTALLVAHEGVNRLLLSWAIGAPLGASAGFEQDTGCINIVDFDLVPNQVGDRVEIERTVIKSVNLTPANYLKNGMNLRSLEAIFTRAREEQHEG
ncbi:MAG: histidine phosphatase family protein [Pseudomonadota bacterium]